MQRRLFIALGAAAAAPAPVVVLISATAEWRVIRSLFPAARVEKSPYGEHFAAPDGVRYFHGGDGKVAAAGSTQYAIDHFHPRLLVNLGTCGGVEGRIERLQIVAVERTVIYDIYEAMGDAQAEIDHYSTSLDLPARLPTPAVRATMYSGDRDLTSAGLAELEPRYHPTVADWESGAIAWVARRSGTPLLILRGVTDLVGPRLSEAQGNLALFERNTEPVMRALVEVLPAWIRAYGR
jgi:adenosylhomocysteine nucleosidase